METFFKTKDLVRELTKHLPVINIWALIKAKPLIEKWIDIRDICYKRVITSLKNPPKNPDEYEMFTGFILTNVLLNLSLDENKFENILSYGFHETKFSPNLAGWKKDISRHFKYYEKIPICRNFISKNKLYIFDPIGLIKRKTKFNRYFIRTNINIYDYAIECYRKTLGIRFDYYNEKEEDFSFCFSPTDKCDSFK